MYFPQEIIFEILSYLPPKSLVQFKSVSKSWLNLISDPKFARANLNRYKNKESLLLFYYRFGTMFLSSIDFHTPSLEYDLKRVLEYGRTRLTLIGVCNGLVLICYRDDRDIVALCLLNPLTRELRHLPELLPYGFSELEMFGLGYDYAKDAYKVVWISHRGYDTCVSVYSLKTNSLRTWKQAFNFGHLVSGSGRGVLIQESLHWLTKDNSDSCTIAAFDLSSETLKNVPPPNCDKLFYDIAVLRGCLCLIACTDLGNEIFVMEKYGLRESWTLKYVIDFLDTSIKPLTLLEDGKVLFMTSAIRRLGTYDGKEDTVIKFEVLGGYDFSNTCTFMESLVSPYCSNENPRQERMLENQDEYQNAGKNKCYVPLGP